MVVITYIVYFLIYSDHIRCIYFDIIVITYIVYVLIYSDHIHCIRFDI